jgi:hypothetical protein
VKAVAISAGAIAPDPVVVVVEVKGCWNQKVRTDAEDQLVQKYIATAQLVLWNLCRRLVRL